MEDEVLPSNGSSKSKRLAGLVKRKAPVAAKAAAKGSTAVPDKAKVVTTTVAAAAPAVKSSGLSSLVGAYSSGSESD